MYVCATACGRDPSRSGGPLRRVSPYLRRVVGYECIAPSHFLLCWGGW